MLAKRMQDAWNIDQEALCTACLATRDRGERLRWRVLPLYAQAGVRFS